MEILKNKWFWIAVVVAIVLYVSVVKKKGPLASMFDTDGYDGYGRKGPMGRGKGRALKNHPRPGMSSIPRPAGKAFKGKGDINERDGRPIMSRPMMSQEAPTPDRIM